nr:MAG TPA: hypothetical protein [Caudoviricetes sp.]
MCSLSSMCGCILPYYAHFTLFEQLFSQSNTVYYIMMS